MKLGMRGEFDAAHRLPNYDGRCANVHGHTYRVEAVFEGDVDQETGMVMDFYELKAALSAVLDGLDHRDLNQIMPNPTAEAIARHIQDELAGALEGRVRLVSVKLWEGRNKWVMLDSMTPD